MAEVVHRNLESMLPQLEELESSGIFSHDEVKQIVRRRRNHEYKLLRRPARKEDFLAAVQYEMNLDQLRQHRKKKLGVASTKHDAEYGIQNRIHSLFSRALKKFKGDLKLWLQHIEFSMQSGHKETLSKTFGRALAIHPHNPGLWVMAAKFEFEDMKDISSARTLLQQGLRANPTSKHLWTEYFRMELLHTDKVKKRRAVLGLDLGEGEEPVSDDFLNNKAASLVYRKAVTSVSDDVEFRLSFLPIYRLFIDTTDLQDEVYGDTLTAFPTHPLVWQASALREWESLVSPPTCAELEALENTTERIYKEGISAVTDKSTLLCEHWDNYITWCMGRVKNESLSDTLRKKAIRRMLTAFKESAADGHLSEEKFKEYVDIMSELGLTEEACEISCQGTTAYPLSVSLWVQRLSCVSQHSIGLVEQLAKKALQTVRKEDSLPIWEFWIRHALEHESRVEEIEALFKSAVEGSAPNVSEKISVLYLEWAYEVGGVKKSRKVYKSLLAERQPVLYSLYQQCIQLETKAVRENTATSLKHLRELYQKALIDYGSIHTELWLGCIELELSLPGGLVSNVGSLHWRALKELNPELTADFISKYSLMQNASAATNT